MKNRMFCLLGFVFLFLSTDVVWAKADSVTVGSPDRKVKIAIEAGEQLEYGITYKGKQVIAKSDMAIVIDDKVYGTGCSISGQEKYSINESYKTRGVHSEAVNHCNGMIVTLGTDLKLDVRVFDDGVAWRYIVDGKGGREVSGDLTSFDIAAGSVLWFQSDCGNYEGVYHNPVLREEVKEGYVCGPPLTFKLPDGLGYGAITEGGLTDFAGMSLVADSEGVFKARLAGTAKLSGKIETPWRVVMVGSDLNTLVNCDIVGNVSPMADAKLFPKGMDTDWVKPGRCVWSWLADNGGVTLDNMKKFAKMASKLGFEYNLVDEGWGHWKEDGKTKWDLIKELVDYSDNLGVKTWVWKAYPDHRGIAGLQTAEKRRDFFKRCSELGIVGVKIDFFNNESQEIIKFYQDALHDAAEYKLMVDFHGANKPTGASRTWPNEVTREGIRGLENGSDWAPLNTTHPFVRYLAGHGDYTPLHFGGREGATSWPHQLASMITFTSPFLCLGVNPQHVIEHDCRDLITSIPTTWDETVVLPCSEIGSLSAFARRKGDIWYLAIMNSSEAKVISVPLEFLGKGKYTAAIYKDNLDSRGDIVEDSMDVDAGDIVSICLRADGGYVAEIKLK